LAFGLYEKLSNISYISFNYEELWGREKNNKKMSYKWRKCVKINGHAIVRGLLWDPLI